MPTIKRLESKGQLDEDGSDELSKRLNEAQKALADRDLAKTPGQALRLRGEGWSASPKRTSSRKVGTRPS
jgi:hypothetical protein